MSIEFYSKTTTYHEFSNFSLHGIEMDGQWYPTVEHYYQAMKFPGHEHAKQIRLAAKPAIAKQLGSLPSVQLREDWEEIKIDVMRAAVKKKFTTHPELMQLLLDTGDEELIEVAPTDYFWGRGESGTGQNWLGKILMDVRAESRERQNGVAQNA